MGILNMTPDSFSDGGDYEDVERALERSKAMLEAGASVIDVGGESTRPGAQPVEAKEELRRVIPIVRLLAEETDALISIDTRKASVAYEALAAGAHLVNDVTGLQDPEMVQVCAELGVPVVIMHMQGNPQTMQKDPSYDDVTKNVLGFLQQQAALALEAGVPAVMLDPGFGFGKKVDHNRTLLQQLKELVALGHPVLLGASRKSTISKVFGELDAKERDPGTLALHLYGVLQGAAMLRVHNVAAHAQALAMWHWLENDG